MSKSLAISLSGEQGDFIQFDLSVSDNEGTIRFTDEGWAHGSYRIKSDGFNGKSSINFTTDDFYRLLKAVHSVLNGKPPAESQFESLEEALRISFCQNSLGHFVIVGKAINDSNRGIALEFEIECDHSALEHFHEELERALGRS